MKGRVGCKACKAASSEHLSDKGRIGSIAAASWPVFSGLEVHAQCISIPRHGTCRSSASPNDEYGLRSSACALLQHKKLPRLVRFSSFASNQTFAAEASCRHRGCCSQAMRSCSYMPTKSRLPTPSICRDTEPFACASEGNRRSRFWKPAQRLERDRPLKVGRMGKIDAWQA